MIVVFGIMAPQTADRRRWWRAALGGGVLVALVPFGFAVYFLLTVPEAQQDGAAWILFAAVIGAPLGFLFGAIGGVIVHVIRGTSTLPDSPDSQANKWPRLGWGVAGALAGLALSSLTSHNFYGLGLLAIWIWLGIVFAQRVGRMGGLVIEVGRRSWQVDGILRPALGALIGLGAGYTVFGLLFWRLSSDGARYSIGEEAFSAGLAIALITYVGMRVRGQE